MKYTFDIFLTRPITNEEKEILMEEIHNAMVRIFDNSEIYDGCGCDIK